MSTRSIHLAAAHPAIAGSSAEANPARPTYLMCAPLFYDVNYVINPWMEGNVHTSSRARAMDQWTRLYEAVGSIADIVLIDPEPGSPDMVFTANAGLERNGIVALSSFFHSERQGEEPHFRRWLSSAGYTVIDIPRATPFEGEGDALFAIDGSCLWAGYGPRTSISSHRMPRSIWNIEVASLHLVDARFYHLDTCFAPLEGGYALYYPQAFDQASLEKIESFYPEDMRIIVSEQDATRFACNAISIGSTIITNEISTELENRLRSLGFDTVQIQLSEFLKAGGAAKCLVMRLSRLIQSLGTENIAETHVLAVPHNVVCSPGVVEEVRVDAS